MLGSSFSLNAQSFVSFDMGPATGSGPNPTIACPQFNPAWGQLLAVRFAESINGVQVNYQIVNSVNTNSYCVNWSSVAYYSRLFFPDGSFTPLSPVSSSSNSVCVPGMILVDGQPPQYGIAQGTYADSASVLGDPFGVSGPLADLLTGTGTVNIGVSTTIPSGSSSFQLTPDLSSAATTIDVTYFYLQAVPEPSTISLLLGGLALLGRRCFVKSSKSGGR